MKNSDSDNSIEWAQQAYALLKKRQEDQKKELQKQESQKKELQKQEDQKKELQKQEDQKKELQKQEDPKEELQNEKKIKELSKTIDEPELGEFDDNFTWSAMVLASQEK